jgi:hypothetical protein
MNRCLEGVTFISIYVAANTVILIEGQNTEDEVLKAAIAKYGKNQWYGCFTTNIREGGLFWLLNIVGLVYRHCWCARHQNNARHVGTNGSTHPSRKLNGQKCV